MAGDDYGRSLRGFGVDILVRGIEAALAFQTEVLETDVVYADRDFAVIRHQGAVGSSYERMLHADHSFSNHPLLALAATVRCAVPALSFGSMIMIPMPPRRGPVCAAIMSWPRRPTNLTACVNAA